MCVLYTPTFCIQSPRVAGEKVAGTACAARAQVPAPFLRHPAEWVEVPAVILGASEAPERRLLQMNFAAIQKKANPYKGQVRPDGASTTLSVERFFFGYALPSAETFLARVASD